MLNGMLGGVFNAVFLKSVKKFGIFCIIYSSLFLLFYITIPYTYPFAIAFVIALAMRPAVRFFKNRLGFRRNAPALVASVMVYTALFGLLGILTWSMVREASRLLKLLKSISPADAESFIASIKKFIAGAGLFFRNIDPGFTEKYGSRLAGLLTSAINIAGKCLSAFLSVVLSLPAWLTVAFLVIVFTYFFSRDMPRIRETLLSALSGDGRRKFENIWNRTIKIFTSYIKAYIIIYFLTFTLTFAGFAVLGAEYPLMLGLICTAADIFPVVGAGLVYLPLAAARFISGNYAAGCGILVLFLLVNIARQAAEQKIVSSSLGIHPAAVLASAFIGLKAFGFAGMIYFTFLLVFYKILRNAKII